MLTVACVLWMGQFLNRRYTPEWVYRLRDMVARELKTSHRFVCLSNIEIEGVETIPLTEGWPGWWSKIELFKHDLGERVLYLDLDTLITGSLDEIVYYPEKIAFAPPHHELLGIPEPQKTSRVHYLYQSSCMVWTPPAGRSLYTHLKPEIIKRLRGDQDWMAEHLPMCATMPKRWFAKLRQCDAGPPEGVKVIIGDGKYKNDTAPWPWVKRIWVDGNILSPESSMAHQGH